MAKKLDRIWQTDGLDYQLDILYYVSSDMIIDVHTDKATDKN